MTIFSNVQTSTALGGARALIDLDRWDPEAVRRAELARARARVLLAGEDRRLRVQIAEGLRRDGHDIIAVHGGHALLYRLGSILLEAGASGAVPDVIILDIHRLGPSGLDVLHGLRRAGWEIPVVLITGFADLRIHAEAIRHRAAVVFEKPFDLEDLRTAVQNLVQR